MKLGIFCSVSQSHGKRILGFPGAKRVQIFLSRISPGLLLLALPPVVGFVSVTSRNLLPHSPREEQTIALETPSLLHTSPERRKVQEGREEVLTVHLTGRLENLLKKALAPSKNREEFARLSAVIVRESLSAGYDPLLIASIIREESTFRREAISTMGARGLMQIMPATGEYISTMKKISWEGAHKLHDPEYNVHLGIGYLNYLRGRFKDDMRMTLVAYNWGPGNLLAALEEKRAIPPAVERYAQNILRRHKEWLRELDRAERA